CELLPRELEEEVVPDDVARGQTLGLLGKQLRVGRRALRARGLLEGRCEPLDAAHAELERFDEVQGPVTPPARPGEVLARGDVLLLLIGDPAQPRLDLSDGK